MTAYVVCTKRIFSTFKMYGLIIKCIVVMMYVCNQTTAQILTDQWISHDDDFGPVINILCAYGDSDYQWIFNNKTLAEKNKLVEADPSRFSVKEGVLGNILTNYGSLLSIKNALKEDAGWYRCQAGYYPDNNMIYITPSIDISVEVYEYLPPSTYPKCSIHPSATLKERSKANFTCTARESSSNLLLTLELQYQNGSVVELGYDTVIKTITLDDNNTVFHCHMTSATFPTAYRNCTTRPIIVLERRSPTTTLQPRLETPSKSSEATTATTIPAGLETSSKSLVSNPTKGQHSDETDSKETNSTYGIIGGSVGALILVLIVAVICIIISRTCLRKSISEQSTPSCMSDIRRNSNGDRNSENQESLASSTQDPLCTEVQGSSSLQNPFYAVVHGSESTSMSEEDTKTNADADVAQCCEDTVNSAIYRNSANQESLASSTQDPFYAVVNEWRQDPLYAVVHGSGSLSMSMEDICTNSDMAYECKDTLNSSIYSEVKQSDETVDEIVESDDESNDRDSCGMVENIIYVSAGPK